MEQISTKSEKALVNYIISLVLCVVLIVLGCTLKLETGLDIIFIVVGSVASAISIFQVISYIVAPKGSMFIDGEQLVLPNSQKITLTDIINVVGIRSKGRLSNTWGTIRINAISGVYRVQFVENCLDVAKKLNNIVQSQKSNTENSGNSDNTDNSEI